MTLPFSGSYAPEDVTFLLKPVAMAATEVGAKERLIQSGRRHYSEMLSAETLPDADYLRLYEEALDRNAARLAQDVVDLAGAMAGPREVVIASLARAGTPIGVLLGRALRRMNVPSIHYSLSIIRDRGIDLEALRTIADRHDPGDVIFVDGWTGKGSIRRELDAALSDRPFGFAPRLAVIADPAGCADIAATFEDYLIPSGLLNSIVSGLVSRSVLNDAVVGPGDYHACVYYGQLAAHDRSRAFVERIDALAAGMTPRPILQDDNSRQARATACTDMVTTLMAQNRLSDRNRIKPGIAEATRTLLRRVPDRVLVADAEDADVAHIVHLALDRDVPVETLAPHHGYRAVAIIRTLGQD